jgi:hypothetical protein
MSMFKDLAAIGCLMPLAASMLARRQGKLAAKIGSAFTFTPYTKIVAVGFE